MTYEQEFRFWTEIVAAPSQCLVSLSVGIVLFAIHRRGYGDAKSVSEAPELLRDPCFLYLAAACFLWAFSGLIHSLDLRNIISSNSLDDAKRIVLNLRAEGSEEETKLQSRLQLEIGRTLVSIMNSTFLLWAAASLDVFRKRDGNHGLDPTSSDRDGGLKSSVHNLLDYMSNLPFKNTIAWVTGISIAIVLLLLAVDGFTRFGGVIDFLYSFATLSVLVFGLCQSFHSRGFRGLAVLAGLSLVFQLVAQFPELDGNLRKGVFGSIGTSLVETPFWQGWMDFRWFLILNSKLLVMTLFLALGFSWMHERAQRMLNKLSKFERNRDQLASREKEAREKEAKLSEMEERQTQLEESHQELEQRQRRLDEEEEGIKGRDQQVQERWDLMKAEDNRLRDEILSELASAPRITFLVPTVGASGTSREKQKRDHYRIRVRLVDADIPLGAPGYLRFLELCLKNRSGSSEDLGRGISAEQKRTAELRIRDDLVDVILNELGWHATKNKASEKTKAYDFDLPPGQFTVEEALASFKWPMHEAPEPLESRDDDTGERGADAREDESLQPFKTRWDRYGQQFERILTQLTNLTDADGES